MARSREANWGSEGEVGEVHEAGAGVWRALAEGAFELEGLAAHGVAGEVCAMGAGFGADGLDLLDLDGRDGGGAEAAGLLIEFHEGAAEVGAVGGIEALGVDGAAAGVGLAEAHGVLGLGAAGIVGGVGEAEGEEFAVGAVGEDGATSAGRIDLPAGGEHDHGRAVLETEGVEGSGGGGGFGVGGAGVADAVGCGLEGFAVGLPVLEEGFEHGVDGGAEAFGVVREERGFDVAGGAGDEEHAGYGLHVVDVGGEGEEDGVGVGAFDFEDAADDGALAVLAVEHLEDGAHGGGRGVGAVDGAEDDGAALGAGEGAEGRLREGEGGGAEGEGGGAEEKSGGEGATERGHALPFVGLRLVGPAAGGQGGWTSFWVLTVCGVKRCGFASGKVRRGWW